MCVVIPHNDSVNSVSWHFSNDITNAINNFRTLDSPNLYLKTDVESDSQRPVNVKFRNKCNAQGCYRCFCDGCGVLIQHSST
jgi:hypothetical protein